MFQRGLQMRSDVFLNDMGLDDLDALGMICLQLFKGGQLLPEGVSPRFSLIPGQPITMTLNVAMPQTWQTKWRFAAGADLVASVGASTDDAGAKGDVAENQDPIGDDLAEFPAPVDD